MPVDDIKADPTRLSTASTPTASTPLEPGAVETIRLRRAILADAPALALVGAATFLEAFTWMLPGADIVAHCAKHHTAAAYESYMTRPETRITLATSGDDAPVGYVMLAKPELPEFDVLPGDIELKRIYLFSRFRAAPVEGRAQVRPAAAMLEAAIEDAVALGRTRLLLGTHANNLRAISFYRRNGFVEAGTRTFQVGSRICSDLIFARPL